MEAEIQVFGDGSQIRDFVYVEDAVDAGALVFHAGTALRGDELVTNGGRVLGVTATDSNVAAARERAYDAVGRISFPGARYRTDIARLAAAVA